MSIPKSLVEALSPMARAFVTTPWDSSCFEIELVGSVSTESRLPSSLYWYSLGKLLSFTSSLLCNDPIVSKKEKEKKINGCGNRPL